MTVNLFYKMSIFLLKQMNAQIVVLWVFLAVSAHKKSSSFPSKTTARDYLKKRDKFNVIVISIGNTNLYFCEKRPSPLFSYA